MDLDELTRITDERDVVESAIQKAEATVFALTSNGFSNLARLAQEALTELQARHDTLNGLLVSLNSLTETKVNRSGVPTPPRSKRLTAEIAFQYMEECPDGRAIVAEEFWLQVDKKANEFGCWNVLFEVRRNTRGTLKKQAYIPWFRKGLPAVRLAWYLSGKAFNPEENVYNECKNELCVNPAHHYQGATGKIKKKRDHQATPETEPSFGELEEFASSAFAYISSKWDPREGVTFAELEDKIVGPKNDIPDAESLRKALRTKKAQTLIHLHEGRWYLRGYPLKPADNW